MPGNQESDRGGQHFTAQREDRVRRYTDLGRDEGPGLRKTQWGVGMDTEGNLIGLYSNPAIIDLLYTDTISGFLQRQASVTKPRTLCDFGGGEGIVLGRVQKELKEQGNPTLGINFDFTEKSLQSMRQAVPNVDWGRTIIGVQADLGHLPLKPGSVDIGVSRYVLQYFPQDKQQEVIAGMWEAMGSSSLLVIQVPWAVRSSAQAQSLNGFLAEIEGVVNKTSPEEVLKHKYYSSVEDLEEITQTLPGMQSRTVRLVDDYQWLVSPKAYTDRFKLDAEQTQRVHTLFEVQQRGQNSTTNSLQFHQDSDTIITRLQDAVMVLEK